MKKISKEELLKKLEPIEPDTQLTYSGRVKNGGIRPTIKLYLDKQLSRAAIGEYLDEDEYDIPAVYIFDRGTVYPGDRYEVIDIPDQDNSVDHPEFGWRNELTMLTGAFPDSTYELCRTCRQLMLCEWGEDPKNKNFEMEKWLRRNTRDAKFIIITERNYINGRTVDIVSQGLGDTYWDKQPLIFADWWIARKHRKQLKNASHNLEDTETQRPKYYIWQAWTWDWLTNPERAGQIKKCRKCTK